MTIDLHDEERVGELPGTRGWTIIVEQGRGAMKIVSVAPDGEPRGFVLVPQSSAHDLAALLVAWGDGS